MEDYQIERVELIKKILPMFGDNFILKGGTAFTLFYGCDRFSEDIDLDSKTNNMNFIDRIKNVGYSTWILSIKKNTPTVFRVMIDYGAKNGKEDYPLKIEVSSRNSYKLKANNAKQAYTTIKGVNVYTIEELLKMKVKTMGDRTKARDVFDVGYLLKKYPSLFDKYQLECVIENMDIKGLDNLSYLLKIEIAEHKLSNIDTDEYILNMYDKAKTLWYKLNNESNLEWE